jgi:hypothetical protein
MKAMSIPRTLKFYRVLLPVDFGGVTYPRGELIAVTAPNKVLLRLIVNKIVKREIDPKQGRCKRCGCTWGRACDGGCGWANHKHTICTRCSAYYAGDYRQENS